MPAVVLTWTAAALPMGIASYAATFVAQYSGSGRKRKIGAVVWTACWLGIIFLPFFLFLSRYSQQVFTWFAHSPELIPLESVYFRIACYGSAAVVFESALSSFYIGQAKTRIVMLVNLFALLVNLVLDWAMIFGYQSIPEMGIAGAAWATTISVWLKVFIYVALIVRRKQIRKFGLHRGIKPDWRMFRRLIRFGGPSGWQMWIEGMAVSTFVLYIGRIGVVEAAATTLAFSVNLIAFIPIVGLGMSVSTLVGQRIGSKELGLARRAVFNGLLIGMVYSGLFAVIYFFLPQVFLWAHSNAALGENYESIESTSIFLLKFVATYCIFDCIQIIYVSALKGAGDTRFVFVVTVLNSILFVFIGLAGVHYLSAEQQLTWWWTIITAWILAYAVIFYWRYRCGQWTQMTVIESEKQ